jgi:hypothetical protein
LSVPFFLRRFLRKDPHTCRWEDVGDDIAREKTSQVLRDAVQYQTGPVAKSVKKSSKQEIGTESKKPSARRNRSPELREGYDDQREVSASAPRPPQQRELRSDQAYNHPNHPYAAYMASMHDPSYSSSAHSTPYRLPVTPATASSARKRPRYYESPLPVYHHSSPHQNNVLTNSLPGIVLSPPSRPQLAPPVSRGYFSGPYLATSSSSPASSNRGRTSHYVPPSVQSHDPWVPDVPPFGASGGGGEFDLFNGELLSDHSDRE